MSVAMHDEEIIIPPTLPRCSQNEYENLKDSCAAKTDGKKFKSEDQPVPNL
jgi:hypothetical protein